jgi:hypothetical protein
LVVSVSVRVAEPIGVSIRDVSRVRDFSVVVGLFASIFTSVEELDADGVGCTTVVVELGVAGAGWTMVVELFGGAESGTVVGSFTTVVEELGAGRSHPASAARASAAMTGVSVLIEISILVDGD